jgi:Xaa-Pro aminopeptidase
MNHRSRSALMMFADSEHDADMYYAVRCSVPDPFLYFRLAGKSHVLVSDLEIDRVRKQARVDRVERFSEWSRKAKNSGSPKPTVADVVLLYLQSHRVKKVIVPAAFPVAFADALRERGLKLEAKDDPFWEERVLKSRGEIAAIEGCLRHTERAIHRAEGVLRKSVIRGNRILHRGRVVTSESLRRVIDGTLMEERCVANHTIVASGDQGCDPHCEGSGPILPHRSLVVDVFPRSGESMYFSDITRTFVKGNASEALRRQYAAVKAGQETGLRGIAPGVQGREVHQSIVWEMEGRGFLTERRDGVMTGFFHGTGHGVGLEIHEAPRVNSTDHILRVGEVVTVEPGLYYPGVGAVRLEDLVVVTRSGNRNLTKYPKRLEIR